MFELQETDELLLTHPLVAAGPIPTANDPEGVYPYETFLETSRRPVLKHYRMLTLGNDHIRVKVCPDLGGRVCSIFLKSAGIETLFDPHVIRPVRILPRHSYIGGGIEVSFPISHTPVQTVPVLYEITQHSGRIYVACGEREVRFGMHWTVEYSLGESDAFLTQRTVFWNPGRIGHPWMSWSNAGVPARPDTEFHFPSGRVLAHGREMRIIDWDSQGPRRHLDVPEMTGYFWKSPDCCAFGAYTPSLGAGIYHIADPSLTPGIKLWTDGVGRDEQWVTQYTLNGDQCLEIQAGPLVDQSVKDILEPAQQRHHVEFWIPSAAPRDIRKLPLPSPRLRYLPEVPWFSWARQQEVSLWEQILCAWQSRQASKIPPAPDLDDNRWAVSGMADLGDALEWTAAVVENGDSAKWLFQLGAWHAGRGDTPAALQALSRSSDDRARALAGCLYRRQINHAAAAANCFRAIQSPAFALHPQVVIERDKALAALGPSTLDERARWLDAVSALDDEWLAERRASFLLDSGHPEAAREILRNTRFQLVHQRYARTRLYHQIEKELGTEPAGDLPPLGEDDLAEFGAYREYQED